MLGQLVLLILSKLIHNVMIIFKKMMDIGILYTHLLCNIVC
jgi:hypothetical protein